MGVARLRCTACKAYFPREEIYFQGPSAKVCSESCFRLIYEKRRRSQNRVMKREAGRSKTLDLSIRQRVRARDGCCRWCGAKGEQIHHILYRSQGGPDFDSNLILLCREHHDMAHSNKKKWQPILLALVWVGYVEGKWVTVPEAGRIVERRMSTQSFH